MSDGGRDGHARGTAAYRRLQAALLAVGIAMFAQLYAPQGVLTEAANALRISPDQSALLISAATIGLAAGVLPWSWVADRIGRLPAMRISLLAALVLGVTSTLWPDYSGVLVVRFLQGGALGGTPALALTYLQEAVHPSDAPRAAGTYVAGTTIGGMAGRLLAAPVGAVLGWRVGVGAVEALCGLAAVAFVVLAPSTEAPGERRRRREMPSPTGADASLRARVRALSTAPMLVLYLQGFALMGAFVSVYNYLAFRVEARPYEVPASVAALFFLAYLAGTWSSGAAGALAARRSRLPVLLAAAGTMIVGLLLLMTPWLLTILAGLVILTVGFFGAHAVASGWTAARAPVGRAQAASIYNLAYYLGSSLVGWLSGVVFAGSGWTAMMIGLIGLVAASAVAATLTLGTSPERVGRRFR
ncbi:MFS transporter [Curtobacterium ammoniigenes]|uniref:MFS transporter n=1 Tax=Curtobacterium ammoniigenes TaxID=395387 RepID=UPI0008358F53|nr:MFS transporter [Curtobacterium ammoniigenes]